MVAQSLKQAPPNWKHLAEKLAEEGDLPGASEIINYVLNVKPEDELSAQDLAGLILKDYGLTNRVIRLANSCFYNPSGTEITTVSKAIVFLGFDFIREIALATGFLEAVLQRTPKGQKNLVLSLLSRSYFGAFLARKLSPFLGVNPEEIFIYTLFHRLVRLLLAIHAPEAYEYLLGLEEEKPLVAKKKLYHLAETLARQWSLPRVLAETLEGSPHGSQEDHLAFLINEIDQAAGAAAQQGRLEPLSQLLKRAGLAQGLAWEVAEDIRQALKDLHPPLSNFVKFTPKREETPEEETKTQTDFYQKAVAEITALLASPEFDYQQILLMVIETICRALSCRNVSLGIVNLRGQEIIIRYGVGEKSPELRGQTVAISSRILDIFHKQVEWSGNLAQLPEAKVLARFWPAADLLFSPLIVLGRPLGMILAVRERPFTVAENQKVATLRNLAVLAIVQERQKKVA